MEDTLTETDLENKPQTLASATATEIAELRESLAARLAPAPRPLTVEQTRVTFCRGLLAEVIHELEIDYQHDTSPDEARCEAFKDLEWVLSRYLRPFGACPVLSSLHERVPARARLEAITISASSSRTELEAVIADVTKLAAPCSDAEQLILGRLAAEAFALAGPGESEDEGSAEAEDEQDEVEQGADESEMIQALVLRAEAAEAARTGVSIEARRAALARDEAVRAHLESRAARAARRAPVVANRSELRHIIKLVRARVPVSLHECIRLPATGSMVQQIAELDRVQHAGHVEGDLRRFGRELAARGVPAWRSVALVMDAWRVRLLGGRERAEAWASAILGRDVYIATYRYPRMIEDDGDLAEALEAAGRKAAKAEGRSPRPLAPRAPREPEFTYRMENPDAEDEHGGEDPREDLKCALVLGDVLISYGNALAGSGRSPDSKALGARHELAHVRERYLDRINGVHLLPYSRQAEARRHRAHLGVVLAVSDFEIDRDELLLEREVGRPVNACSTTPDEVRKLAAVVLARHRFKERAAAVCGVARPTFTRWLSADPTKYRAPDDRQLAALREAARSAAAA